MISRTYWCFIFTFVIIIQNNYITFWLLSNYLLLGHNVRMLGQKKASGKKVGGASLNLPKIRKNPLIEIIAINTG